MRLIGHLPAEADARRFVDYLLTQRIAAHAEPGPAGQQIWVEHDDRLEAARDELARFAAAPADSRYDAATDAGALRKQQEQAARRRQKNFRDVRTTVFAAPDAATPATFVVIGLAVALYVVTHYGGPAGDRVLNALLFDDPNGEDIVGRWAMFDSVARGQLWRLVTPAFLHGGTLHILFNMMWVLDLGRRIEPMKGSGKFVGLVLGLAVLSNTAQAAWYALTPFEPGHWAVFLGMSGVVAGLFGYAWAVGTLRPYERIAVTKQESGLMIGWLVICSFGLVGPIANAAHWGGLAAGVLIGAAPSWVKRRKPPR